MAGGVAIFRPLSGLLKVSGANETRGAKRGANGHSHQIRPGYVQPWTSLVDGTLGHADGFDPVARENDLVSLIPGHRTAAPGWQFHG
jgi:hypothetical protein